VSVAEAMSYNHRRASVGELQWLNGGDYYGIA
jgi:hypothetical protein